MIMPDRLTLLVCDYFLQETLAVITANNLKNIEAAAFTSDCDHPLKEITRYDTIPVHNNPNTIALGGDCLIDISNRLKQDNLEDRPTISLQSQCFELLLPHDELHHYLDEGAHLFTPAMLDNWLQINKEWQFSDSDRQQFFAESTSKLVLIDAGLDPSADEKIQQIATQLKLPWEIKAISLDHLHYQILQQFFSWRTSLLAEKDKRLSDYAMVHDLISNMVTFHEEHEVINQTLEIFHMFCATSNVCYLSLTAPENAVFFGSQITESQKGIIQQLKAQSDNYLLQKDSFQILVKREQQILGIIAVFEVAFPRYITHYLNLTLNIMPVIALAISNAQIYQQQLAAEKKIRSLNQELNTQLDSVNALNHELETFTYSVSHDLRSPLRSLDGFSNILLRDYSESLDERGQGFLNRIRANAQRMGQLIDDLLRLSRLTRAELNIEPIDLSTIALEISQNLKFSEPDRKVDFIIADNLKARGDLSLLKAVLENLIGNSWKYTSKCSQAEISINKKLVNGKECFYIKDNGAGFDMAYTDKLFAPFQRLHSPDDYPGTGIGLATVQRIIQRHRGKIWGESKPEQGACFYFTIGSFDTQK